MTTAEAFLRELAARQCVKSSTRYGCNGADPEPDAEVCDPCRARRITGDSEAARWCDSCGIRLYQVGSKWMDPSGNSECRAHFPSLYYDELKDRTPRVSGEASA